LVAGVQWVSAIFDGVALIVAVALDTGRKRRIAKGSAKRKDRSFDDMGNSSADTDLRLDKSGGNGPGLSEASKFGRNSE
jgi:hypothetical protein